MSKILRKTQLQFGSSAAVGPGGIGQYGSFAAGSIAYTKDPAVIQALSNYLDGWSGAVVGPNSPAIEDENSLAYLWAYQLGYIMQAGVAEWDSGTTYYKGSLVNNGGGLIYGSLTDTNMGNAVTDTTKWKLLNSPAYDLIIGTEPFCTHATLAAAVADSNTSTNLKVLLMASASATLASTVLLTKSGWRIEAMPGFTFTAGAATVAVSVRAANISLVSLRYSGFASAITFNSSGTYCRVKDNNYVSCTKGLDDSGAPNGNAYPVEEGLINEP